VLALAVLALVAQAGAARADEAEGKRHWKLGQELYAQKRFIEAAHEFEAGYAVAPRPLFLMNIGHAYRRANELVKAKSAYEALLRAQPDLQQRAEVEDYIKSINDALQAGETSVADQGTRAPTPPPPPTPSRIDTSSTLRPSLPTTVSTPSPAIPPYVEARETTADRSSEESVSVFRKPWFWVVTGALIAGGVAVAVIASRPSTSCPGTLCIRE
jgi:tetratricopeptide (TPR) repeat protein